jgi:hypothetical protein
MKRKWLALFDRPHLQKAKKRENGHKTDKIRDLETREGESHSRIEK